MASGPLDGLKVVEIGVAMAAPFCSMILGDHGAEVVKIERVGRGDDSRAWPPHFDGGLSHYFASANRNKRSLAIDLKDPEGAEAIARLVDGADIVVENYRVGALERAGLGYEALSKRNPGLVYCSISGFGREGPRAEERANDLFMQAFSGSMSVTGEIGGGPVRMGISAADVGAGLFAAIGVLAAIEARHGTGEGQHVTTSLLGGQLAMLSFQLTAYFASGQVPMPQGSGAGIGVPYQGFPTSDGWLIVAVFNEVMWANLCEALDRPEWVHDPRFATIDARVVHRDLILGLLAERLATRPAEQWASLLSERGIPSTPVNRIDQVIEDPQVVQQGMISEVDVPDSGRIRMASTPLGFSATPEAALQPPPRLGEHSREVLVELGYPDAAIDALAARGVVGLAASSEAAL